VEFTIIINQAALRRWIKAKTIKTKEAMIIGFIRGLSADDPQVRRYMQSGYYLLSRAWILREMPLLSISEDWLGRCLKKLEKLGLVELISTVDGHHRYRTYGRLSKLYFQEEAHSRAQLDPTAAAAVPDEAEREVGENSELGENSLREKNTSSEKTPSGRILRARRKLPWEKTPTDHKEKIKEAVSDPPPSGGAASDTPEEPEPTPAELEILKANLPWRRRSEVPLSPPQLQLPGLEPPPASGPAPPEEPKDSG